jgi:hypothetical protein
MPWNGSGTFTRTYSWVTDAANGIDITASRMDTDTNDITTAGLGNALTRDGQGFASANLPMNNFRHTTVGNGVARTDYAAMGQVQDAAPTVGGTSTGAAGVFAITLTPAITAYAAGQRFSFITHQAAAGADTLNANTVGAKPIVKGNGTAVAVNDFASGQELLVLYDTGGGGRFILLNTPLGAITINTLNLGTAGSAIGTLTVSGNTSGTITIQPQAAAGTYNFNLPITAGTLGQPMLSGGGGAAAMSWGSLTGTGSTFALSVSPAFTGTPTVPTPALSDNSTTAVNSAWVRGFVTSTINLPLAATQPMLTFNSPPGT